MGDDISFGELFSGDYKRGEKFIEYTANRLHEARLIHGTIYDEDGRIEDKDVAHQICLSHQEHVWWFNNLDGHIRDAFRNEQIRGTIFY
jgi:hypothetical protein